MEHIINITGEIGADTTYMGVLSKVADARAQGATSLRFVIDSVGGYVDEGFRIARLIEDLDIPAVTVAKKVYSIANVIFFAGHTREADKGAEWMLHMAWFQPPAGNADDLRSWAQQLDIEDAKIRNYITERTALTDSQLKQVMAVDTFVNTEQAKSLGFFTARARLRMCAKFTKNRNMNAIDKAFLALKNAIGMGAKNLALELEDGNTINVETEDGEFVGKVTDAPDGMHRLRDGREITVAGGIITAITEAVMEDKAMAMGDDELEMMKAEIVALKAQLAEATASKAEAVASSEAFAKQVEKQLFDIRNHITTNGKALQKMPTFGAQAQDPSKRGQSESEILNAKAQEVLKDKLSIMTMTEAEFRASAGKRRK